MCISLYSGPNWELNYIADLCVEWLKCRARATRWKEEIELLEEEMRRAIQFCAWKANWWEEQAGRRTLVSAHLAEGIAAYAAENATAERRRLLSWLSHWEAVRQRARLVLENHLSGNEEGGQMGALEIEIEDEDDEAPIFDSDNT
jgi:hypothetical protein